MNGLEFLVKMLAVGLEIEREEELSELLRSSNGLGNLLR